MSSLNLYLLSLPCTCTLQECALDVLSQVLHQLNQLLQDRGLTLSSLPDLSPLCQLLCQLVDEKSPCLQKLRYSTNKQSKFDLSSAVFTVLTTLITYTSHLDRAAQVLLEPGTEHALQIYGIPLRLKLTITLTIYILAADIGY